MSASVAQPAPSATPAAEPPPRTLEQIQADILRLDEDALDELFDWVWRLQESEPSGMTDLEVREMIARDEEESKAGKFKSWEQLRAEMKQWPID